MRRIKILPEAYEKIMYWVEKCPCEISGLGRVIFDKDEMIISDTYLLKQKVTGASTDIEPEEIGKLEYETRDIEGNLNFWWHSHVDFSCYWSGTDRDTIKQYGEHGWVLAGVFNKKKERKVLYYQNSTDLYPSITMEDLDLEIYHKSFFIEDWEKEYEEKVKTYTTYGRNTNYKRVASKKVSKSERKRLRILGFTEYEIDHYNDGPEEEEFNYMSPWFKDKIWNGEKGVWEDDK